MNRRNLGRPYFVYDDDAPSGGQPPAPTAPAADPPEAKPDETVPRYRLNEVEQQKKDLQAQLAAAQAWREEQEAKSLSEVERERKAREAAERARDEAVTTAQTLTRGTWVRSAATAAGFLDPEDAVVNLNLTLIEDEAQARQQVKDLASRKKHLLKQEAPTPALVGVLAPTADGTLPNGEPKAPLTREQIAAMSPDDINANWEAVQAALSAQ